MCQMSRYQEQIILRDLASFPTGQLNSDKTFASCHNDEEVKSVDLDS